MISMPPHPFNDYDGHGRSRSPCSFIYLSIQQYDHNAHLRKVRTVCSLFYRSKIATVNKSSALLSFPMPPLFSFTGNTILPVPSVFYVWSSCPYQTDRCHFVPTHTHYSIVTEQTNCKQLTQSYTEVNFTTAPILKFPPDFKSVWYIYLSNTARMLIGYLLFLSHAHAHTHFRACDASKWGSRTI